MRRNELISLMASYGFMLEGTGGNCEAFIRRNVDGSETWVTDGDASLPDGDMNADVYVGIYNVDDEGYNVTLSLADTLASLAHGDFSSVENDDPMANERERRAFASRQFFVD